MMKQFSFIRPKPYLQKMFCTKPLKKVLVIGKVQVMQNYSENFFLLIFLHHLIECELLITKNNFLPYANIFFRSKNTKNLKDVRFFKKHIFFKTCHIFCFLLFLCFWEYFFQIQHQKPSLNEFLNRLQTRNSIGGCASNRIECTT